MTVPEIVESQRRKEITVSTITTIVVSDVFEISGHFDAVTCAVFAELDRRVTEKPDEAELIRYELELVCDLCTNTEESLSSSQLTRVVEFLIDKLNSVECT